MKNSPLIILLIDGKDKNIINWWSKYSLEVFKRPPSGDRTFQSVHTAKHNMMMIIWRVIYSWHDYRTGLTPSEKLNLHLNGVSCFGMEPPRTKIWGIQVWFVHKFKCANLVQIFWTKKCTFYIFFSFALSDVVCNKRGQRYEEFKSGKCTACQMPKSATLLSCVV